MISIRLIRTLLTECERTLLEADGLFHHCRCYNTPLAGRLPLIEVSCDAELAFGPSEGWWDAAEEGAIYVRRGSDLTPATVADIFERAAFDPSEDADADSSDTQREQFSRTVMTRAIGMMEGPDAALEAQVRARLAAYSWLVPENRTVSVQMTRDGLTVEIVERTPEAE